MEIYEKWSKISYRKLPEANIQAELYCRLKQENIDCFLEYKVNRCRVDCAIFKDYELFMVVEVKSYKELQLPNLDTKQLEKYRNNLGVPVIVFGRMEHLEHVINIIKNKYYG